MLYMQNSLNPKQKEAIEHGFGPLLIIAGAGTGKTTVITERIKHLIIDKEIQPGSILALTFTEKASFEMQERIDLLMPYGYTNLWIHTFHSFCDRVLRDDVHAIGLDPNYKLVFSEIAKTYLRMNDKNKAIEYFKKSVNQNPENPSPANNLAVVYMSIGKFEQAKEILEEQLKKHPENGALKQNYEECVKNTLN